MRSIRLHRQLSGSNAHSHGPTRETHLQNLIAIGWLTARLFTSHSHALSANRHGCLSASSSRLLFRATGPFVSSPRANLDAGPPPRAATRRPQAKPTVPPGAANKLLEREHATLPLRVRGWRRGKKSHLYLSSCKMISGCLSPLYSCHVVRSISLFELEFVCVTRSPHAVIQ